MTRGTILCARATLARSFRERRRGLSGRSQLAADEGMLFEAEAFIPLMWMHTLFMAFPIDIVFLGHGDQVLRTQLSVKPWRLSALVLGACKALELAAGSVIRTGTAVGDRLLITRI